MFRRMLSLMVLTLVGSVPLLAVRRAGSTMTTASSRRDADLVVVLPALDRPTLEREQRLLRPWLARQHVASVVVPLFAVLRGRPAAQLTAEELRRYLRDRFTWRVSTEARPRYLAIFASPAAGYTGGPSTAPPIPRFAVHVRPPIDQYFTTDVPYEFLAPQSIDAVDGTADVHALDLRVPTFDVFRVPVRTPNDIRTFVERDRAFARSSHRSDVTLAAGSAFAPGDTASVQCLTANALMQQQLATRVLKVFDSPVCTPDVVTSPGGPRLADVLAGVPSAFGGGLVLDISHGSPPAVYGQPGFYPNLAVPDVARIPAHRLNVFVSIACDNDGATGSSGPNLAAAMYERASVAVVAATTTVTPVDAASVLEAEVTSTVGLYQHHENLLQRLHALRADYYDRFVLPTSAAQPLHWLNMLAVNVIGDGLVTVAR
jgi:hypothetical protein